MPTFVLKKYEEKQTQKENHEQENQNTEENGEEVAEKEMSIQVSGTVSEIVANALNKVFVNKNVRVEEVEDSKDGKVDGEAISSEDIQNDPVLALRTAKTGSFVLISTEGFKTKKDEWFLYNMEEYKGKVFYTVESFVEHIAREFNDVSHD